MLEKRTAAVPEEELARQRQYTAAVKELLSVRGRQPRALVDTFGCQQNEADSELLRGLLQQMGCAFTDRPEEADVVVLNTCAIREHAEQRVYGNLGALTHTKRPIRSRSSACAAAWRSVPAWRKRSASPTVTWIWCSGPRRCGAFRS